MQRELHFCSWKSWFGSAKMGNSRSRRVFHGRRSPNRVPLRCFVVDMTIPHPFVSRREPKFVLAEFLWPDSHMKQQNAPSRRARGPDLAQWQGWQQRACRNAAQSFPRDTKVFHARAPGATAARRQPISASLTPVRRRLSASTGAYTLEKWLGVSHAVSTHAPAPETVLPDRALYLPTFSHFLSVKKTSLSLSPERPFADAPSRPSEKFAFRIFDILTHTGVSVF